MGVTGGARRAADLEGALDWGRRSWAELVEGGALWKGGAQFPVRVAGTEERNELERSSSSFRAFDLESSSVGGSLEGAGWDEEAQAGGQLPAASIWRRETVCGARNAMQCSAWK